MLAVGMGKVFRTATTGRCEARPDLVGRRLPLQVTVPALPGGADLVDRLLTPLVWRVQAQPLPLDESVTTWGDSRYCSVTLTGEVVLADALTQLHVLIPALDDRKHYWVGEAEIDKLLRAGGSWLAAHPERELVTRRYLGSHRLLVDSAIGRLAELDDTPPEAFDDDPALNGAAVQVPPRPTPLAVLPAEAVKAALVAEGARSVVDLGVW